ncbi:WbqC family protein [Exiguobacterium sp. SH0S2]|uniref:WbqC family protein n=1 Tax=Exiguobacterium sp. SH0S2 TaxID=2510950 RepID=UPI001F48C24F|nr:WbqC family protein [Exiguobacterium sp. SH0S2]
MKLAIMQPYYFPYLGYFQLMAAVDTFVILDDVQFIKGGWIHRNTILLEGKTKPILMPVEHMSQLRLINEHDRVLDSKQRHSQLRLIRHAYQRAPHFDDVMPMVERIMKDEERNVAAYLGSLLSEVRDYVGLDTSIVYSSELTNDKNTKCEHLVLSICEHLDADHYINAIGGTALYDKAMFAEAGVELDFIKMDPVTYRQFNEPFTPNLSIIDVLMFNSKPKVRELLNAYTLT